MTYYAIELPPAGADEMMVDLQTHLWVKISDTEWVYAAGNSAHWAPGSLIVHEGDPLGEPAHGSTSVTFDPETEEYVFTVRVKRS